MAFIEKDNRDSVSGVIFASGGSFLTAFRRKSGLSLKIASGRFFATKKTGVSFCFGFERCYLRASVEFSDTDFDF